MKKYLIVLLAIFSVSCQQKFKEQWDLTLDRESLVLSSTTESTHFTIYCTDNWTVRVVTGEDWITLSRTSGSGVTEIYLSFTPNPGLSRKGELEVVSAGITKTLQIMQYPGIALPTIAFAKKDLSFPSSSFAVQIPFDTNIPLDYFDKSETRVEYIEGADGWLSNLSVVTSSEPSPEEAGMPDGKRCQLLVTLRNNLSELPRQAKVVLYTDDGFGEFFKDSILVNQSSYAPFLAMPVTEDKVSRDGISRNWHLDTNLTDVLNDESVSVTYPMGDTPFLSDLKMYNGTLSYTVAPNPGSTRRRAIVSVGCTDKSGREIKTSLNLEQKMEVPVALTIPELRSRFPSTGIFNDAAGTEAYVEGIIECDGGEPNVDQNLQYGTTVDGYAVTVIDTSATGSKPTANSIFTTENDRTNYLQDAEGNYGLRLKYLRASENICRKGDKVRVYLNKVKVICESSPTRYTLGNLSTVDVISSGNALPSKQRTVSGLEDNDIYTTVTLMDMEFQIKRGTYGNVREYDAVENPVNMGLNAGTNQARKSKDGAANLLFDRSGKGIYMLLNMNTLWRWDAKNKKRRTVPQGSGTVTGVIVHQEMARWGGDIGRYSIRPITDKDISMGVTSSNGFHDLVEWTFTRKNWSINQYSWNANTTTLGGYNTSGKPSDAQITQNKLNATAVSGMTNETGDVASLYSENVRQMEKWASGDAQYPVKPAWGYRGFLVTDYNKTTIENAQDQTFGMSAGSVIQYLLNPSGFYEWNGTTWTGKTYGIVAEFTTEGKSGSQAAISFSIAGGVLDRSVANISWRNSHSFPLDWAVEYATSSDGTNWTSWSKATNAATGLQSFEMRTVPFCVSNVSSYVSFHSTTTSTFYTNIDNGFGLVPYRFTLPASILNQKRVKVRIVPTTLRMASWNAGGDPNWARGIGYRNEQITPTFEISSINLDHYCGICLEDVLIQYK
ncbi:MAG: BACON domain-containing protein [Bacteroidales bacterium]|nr:BACON domain-containing protein [Bacteroidales bacterium]